MHNIIIITDYRGFLRQNRKISSSINVNELKEFFKSRGFSVFQISFDEIVNNFDKITFKNDFIIYSSSQQMEYKLYIDDAIYELGKSNFLIPRYELFRAHENKGFQEVIKKGLGLNDIWSLYLANEKDYKKEKGKFEFPLVLKTVWGSTGTNVFKIDSYEQGLKIMKKKFKKRNDCRFVRRKIILWLKYFLKGSSPALGEANYVGRFILQDFIPGLSEDWRVVIFGDKYYVRKRYVRENDFRASGSKNKTFEDPPEGLLDYAEKVFERLNTPFLALDIGEKEGDFFLFEFQATHFGGVKVLLDSEYFFAKEKGKWRKNKEKSKLSEEFGKSILKYIDKNSFIDNSPSENAQKEIREKTED